MKKMELRSKVDIAWFKKTGKTDGWEVWLKSVGRNTQEEIARLFGVSMRTSARWHEEHKQEV